MSTLPGCTYHIVDRLLRAPERSCAYTHLETSKPVPDPACMQAAFPDVADELRYWALLQKTFNAGTAVGDVLVDDHGAPFLFRNREVPAGKPLPVGVWVCDGTLTERARREQALTVYKQDLARRGERVNAVAGTDYW